MCVICYIPKGTELPKRETIKAMWDSNPDGGGMQWIADGKVCISKGYFNFEEFYKDILIIKDYDYELAIHMRIATAGGVSQRMCHPFPISNKPKDIFSLEGKYDSAIMHNGIINIHNRKEYSDTAEFIVSNLYSRYQTDHRFYNHLSSKAQNKLERQISGSKMIFFGGDGSVKMIGHWDRRGDGCYYSNLHFAWKENRYNYGYGYKYNSYYDYDDTNIYEDANTGNKYKTYTDFCIEKYGFAPF